MAYQKATAARGIVAPNLSNSPAPGSTERKHWITLAVRMEHGVCETAWHWTKGRGRLNVKGLAWLRMPCTWPCFKALPPSPGKEPVTTFSRLGPKNGMPSLRWRRAMLLSSAPPMHKGQIEFVQIHSNKGGPCRVQNPWNDAPISLYRNGKETETLSGKLLVIPTAAGETVALAPKGRRLSKEASFSVNHGPRGYPQSFWPQIGIEARRASEESASNSEKARFLAGCGLQWPK